jgi:SAM-dependent methyltransferase
MTSPVTDRPSGPTVTRDPGSYRDPSGFVYRRDGILYRQVDRSFGARWDAFLASGLHDRLVERGILVADRPVDLALAADASAHAVVRPEEIPFVSYPYEWTFGQLRDAALLTLDAQSVALAAGFTLRDASAYNVQFLRGRPILIDTLSFEPLEPGTPWVAYRQFCEHFLAPLALAAYRDVRALLLLRDHLDGIPLDLASRLLPARSRLRFGLLSHVHLHARAQRRFAESAGPARRASMGDLRRAALIESLRGAVKGLAWKAAGTEWADYTERTNYTDEAASAKAASVGAMLDATGARVVWDLGANTGRFSQIAADGDRRVVAFDIDPAAAERHYRALRSRGEERTLPLVMDLANPSPGLGWANAERRSLADRADADVVLALALVHHLAIARNVPLAEIGRLFARLAPHAIVEFVPKEDSMVQRLLATREDVFPEYTLEGFRRAVGSAFEIVEEVPIAGSVRVLFRLRRRS